MVFKTDAVAEVDGRAPYSLSVWLLSSSLSINDLPVCMDLETRPQTPSTLRESPRRCLSSQSSVGGELRSTGGVLECVDLFPDDGRGTLWSWFLKVLCSCVALTSIRSQWFSSCNDLSRSHISRFTFLISGASGISSISATMFFSLTTGACIPASLALSPAGDCCGCPGEGLWARFLSEGCSRGGEVGWA